MQIYTQENEIIIKDFYNQEENIEKPLDFGLWKLTTQSSVPNPLKPGGGSSSDMMHFMYNNAYQPGATAEGCKPINGYAEGSRANQGRYLGSMKEIWKQFEFYCNNNGIDCVRTNINEVKVMFWNFYIEHYSNQFYLSCKMMEDYVREKRNGMTLEERQREREYMPSFLCDDDVWIEGCKDYLRYLVIVSVRGFRMELFLCEALKSLYGGYIIESTQEMEKDGMDFIYVKNNTPYIVSVKPDTYLNKKCPSPLYVRRVAVYNRYGKKDSGDLIFRFTSGSNILTDTKHPYDIR